MSYILISKNRERMALYEELGQRRAEINNSQRVIPKRYLIGGMKNSHNHK